MLPAPTSPIVRTPFRRALWLACQGVATLCAVSTAACSPSAGTTASGDGPDAGAAVDGAETRNPQRDASSGTDSHAVQGSFDASDGASFDHDTPSDAAVERASDAIADASAGETEANRDARAADAASGPPDAVSGPPDAVSGPPDAAEDAAGSTDWRTGLPAGTVRLTYTVTQPNCAVTDENFGNVTYESVMISILVTGTNPGSLQVTLGSGTADPVAVPVGGDGTWSYHTTPPGPNYDYVEYAGTIDGLSMTVSYGASFGGQQGFITCSDMHGTAP